MHHGGDMIECVGGPLPACLEDLLELGGAVAADAPGHGPCGSHDLHHRPGLEVPTDADDTGQEKRLLADGDGPLSTGIDRHAPLGNGGVGHPQSPAGTVRTSRREPGAQVDGHFPLPQQTGSVVGRCDDGGRSGGAGDRRGLKLGTHSAGAE